MGNKLKFFLRNHYLALIFAVVAGAVALAPQLQASFNLGEPYRGAYLMFSANEDIYLARIREITDGHWRAGSPLFYEYKNRGNLMPPVGEYVYALPALIFRLPLASVMIASKFVLPAILFFLIYFLILRLTVAPTALAEKINAAAGGLLVVLGYDLTDYHAVWQLITGRLENFNFLIWTRPVNPVIGGILLFSFLLLLRTIYSGEKKYLFIPAGLVLSLMSGYFFGWGLALAILFSLFVISLWRKDYWFSKNAVYIFLVSLVVEAPLWLSSITSLAGAGQSNILKYGGFFTHQPIINKFLLALTLVFAWLSFFIWRENRRAGQAAGRWWWFCLALIGGGWLAFNQQIVTGLTIWPYHFVQYTIPLAIVIAMVLMVNFIKPKFKYLWPIAILFIFLSVVVYNVFALKSYANFNGSFIKLQRKMPLFDYLNSRAEKDCVVLADSEENSLLIPALTHCNVYASAYVIDGVPAERVKHNFLVYLRLNGVPAGEVEDYLLKNQGYLRAHFYENWNQIFKPADDEWFKNLVKEISSAYKDFVKKDFARELKKYRLDYVLLADEAAVGGLLPNLVYADSAGDLTLYKF